MYCQLLITIIYVIIFFSDKLVVTVVLVITSIIIASLVTCCAVRKCGRRYVCERIARLCDIIQTHRYGASRHSVMLSTLRVQYLQVRRCT